MAKIFANPIIPSYVYSRKLKIKGRVLPQQNPQVQFNRFSTELLTNDILYTGCPKKVETRFNFLAIEDKHAV